MAQLALAAAGAAVGSLVGAPQAGWLIGAYLGGQLFGSPGAKTEGPRLGDLQVQASTYGMGIPQVFGSMRLAGNVIWALPLLEQRHEERAGKGGGPSVVSYRYAATFAVALAQGPVQAIRRIWADGKLLVDLSENASGGRSFRYGERIYRLHLGGDDQAPDPVMEMHLGVGQVPAYRGLAYVTFDQLPLADFGNRIPNITAEVLASAETVHPRQHVDVTGQGVASYGKAGWRLDPERPWLYNLSSGWLLKLNRVTGQVVYRQKVDDQHPELAALWAEQGWQGGPGPLAYAIEPDSGDIFLALTGLSRTTFVRLDADTLQLKAWYRQGSFSPGPMLAYGGRYLACKSSLNGPLVVLDFGTATGPAELAAIGFSQRGVGLALDPERSRLYVLTRNSSGSSGWLSWLDAALELQGPFQLEDDLGLPAGSAPSGISYDRVSGRLILGASTGLFALHAESLAIEQSLPSSYVSGGFVDAWENQVWVEGELWLPDGSTVHRIDTTMLSLIASWNVASLHGVGLDAAVPDPLTEALWTSDGGVWKLWFDRQGHGTVSLGSIVTTLCGKAGLAPSDLEVSELDQAVQGYLVPRPVAVRAALEQLQQAYLFDVVESDWRLAFRRRNRPSIMSIPDASLAAHEPGSQRPPKLLETRTQEAELPRRVTLRYLSRANDYQAAAQQAQLIQDLYETRHELVLELPVVMAEPAAKRAAWAILASAWVERDSIELFLPPAYLALDPGDVIEVEKTRGMFSGTLRLRLTEIDLSGGWLLRVKGVLDDPVVWQTEHAVAAPVPQANPGTIPFELPSAGFLLNLPALAADDGQSGGFWLAAAPAWDLANGSWRGAVIYRSGDGVTFTDYAASTTAARWGKARTILPVHERWGVWDEVNSLEVLSQSPNLAFESQSELAVLAGANLLLVGQEILQFAQAEQLGSAAWRLSKLLRGRKGTEWAMASHQVGETVLLLDPTTLIRMSSLDEVGQQRFYKTVSLGADPSLPAAVAFTNEAASLKPYAAVQIRGSRNGTGDLTISWTRRTRYSGEWRDLVDVPLGEASEAYEVDLLDGAGDVVRTLSCTTPTVTYGAADQTTDFGAPQSLIEVRVYQLSAAVGRGYAGRASL